MTQLNQQQVRQVIDRAVEKAEDMGLRICVAVADTGANVQGFLRMDKAFLGSAEVSQRKAKTSVYFQCPSDVFGQVIDQEKLIGMDLSNGGLMAFAGGLPIKVEEELLGGIGISGATAAQDKEIAEYAIAFLGE